ncbi:MAG: TraC family protein [Candidatus Kerfeldbacteria bacterium]|nr:TraC family protein [Candidatus Kerfeldbacteria bacterium]
MVAPTTPKATPRKTKAAPSTQQYLDILEIRDDTVILRNGSIVAVLLVASINFSLKSDEEQDAVIEAYTSFLNTIDFPLQIVIQSRRLDIDDYLETLKDVEKKQQNELLQIQIRDYRQFVADLVQMSDIMTKRFYVVVPFTPKVDRPGKFFSRLLDVFTPTSTIHLKQKQFEQFRVELYKRVDHVINALGSAGLKSLPLRTQELIELYYNTYNPETSRQQKLQDTNKINLEDTSSIKEDHGNKH